MKFNTLIIWQVLMIPVRIHLGGQKGFLFREVNGLKGGWLFMKVAGRFIFVLPVLITDLSLE